MFLFINKFQILLFRICFKKFCLFNEPSRRNRVRCQLLTKRRGCRKTSTSCQLVFLPMVFILFICNLPYFVFDYDRASLKHVLNYLCIANIIIYSTGNVSSMSVLNEKRMRLLLFLHFIIKCYLFQIKGNTYPTFTLCFIVLRYISLKR